MTLVATPVPDNAGGIHAVSGYYDVFVDIAISGNYATGGDALDLTIPGKRGGGRGSILMAFFEAPLGYELRYDRTNKKLLFYTSGGTELAAAAYPAGVTGTSVRGMFKTL
jgi:hypothetical protein